MPKKKLADCITFFDNNFMFDLRYNILKNYVDYFVVCESKFDHKGNEKGKNFMGIVAVIGVICMKILIFLK